MDCKNEQSSLFLPNELIDEILPRLPVKSLLRFRCISKSWRSLISSEQFITTYFKRSAKNTSLSHHIVFLSNEDELKQCFLQSLLNEPSIDPSSPIDDLTNTSVVGCYNGLFCILKHPASFFLWNPATRISIELPKICHLVPNYGYVLDKVIPEYGFGWDEASGAYKVFTLVDPEYGLRRCIVGKVYSSKTKRWKTIRCGTRTRFGRRNGQFVCGKIHWAKNHIFVGGHDIESFDLETHKFGTVELPFDREDRFHLWLGEIGGCLSVLYDDKKLSADVWVMKEYGVKDSWRKLVTVPHVYVHKLYLFNSIFGGLPNGEVLLIYSDTLLVYYPKDDVFLAAESPVRLNEAFIYVESLVSPVSIIDSWQEAEDTSLVSSGS